MKFCLYIKKKLKFEENIKQIIKDEEGKEIGILINIVDMSKHLNLYKYEQIKPPETYLENLSDGIPFDNKNQYNVGEIIKKSNNNSNNNNNQSLQNPLNSIISDESSIYLNPIAKLVKKI